MVKTLGFSSACVYYSRTERKAGQTKYPLHRMLSFAIDGVTSFSVRPLRMIAVLGMVFMFIAVCAIVYGLYSFITNHALPGWTSLLISVWFIGGAILMSLGMMGEYIGKIYKEVKRRPRYLVEKLPISHQILNTRSPRICAICRSMFLSCMYCFIKSVESSSFFVISGC